MERYQEADQAAANTLVTTLSPVLLRFFRYQGARREEAEDLLQDTWLRIHRVRRSYRPGAPLLPWVYAIARRARVDHYRRRRRVSSHEVTAGDLPEAPAPDPLAAQEETFGRFMAALPEAQREVLTMLKVGGLTVDEVARATSSTAGAVKQKAHRAYQKLRQLLDNPRVSTGTDTGER